MNDATLLSLSLAEFIELVNAAFKRYSSLLELSRSPLARSTLVAPALVLDPSALAPDDLGRALRVVLRWAVSRLAPSPPRYPLGTLRPLEDPTWTDPAWWQYTILRHRYLEPIPPDEFFEGSGRIDTLLARTGIPSRDCLFDERNRAIRDVALLLRRRLAESPSDDELRRRAVEGFRHSLEDRPAVRDLLALAATFRTVFPRSLLLSMAAEERIPDPERSLDHLILHRMVVEGDGGTNLLVPPALQRYLLVRGPAGASRRRHRRAAEFYRREGRIFETVWHLQQAGENDPAADLLIREFDQPIQDPRPEELRDALHRFTRAQLSEDRWFKTQELLGSALYRLGDREGALEACRRALQAASTPAQEARAYHGLGVVCQEQDPKLSLQYYEEAEKRLPPEDPFWADLYTRLGYFHLTLRQLDEAEGYLEQALERLDEDEKSVRGSVHDALAVIHCERREFEDALSHAQRSLVLREARGLLREIADSYLSLGWIHGQMGERERAIAIFRRAVEMHRRVERGLKLAIALNNLGVTLNHAGRYREAIPHLEESLAIDRELQMEVRAAPVHYNLAFAHAGLEATEPARLHWQAAYTLAQERKLEALQARLLQMRDSRPGLRLDGNGSGEGRPEASHPAGQAALELARRDGQVTSRALMERAEVSRASAKRVLQGLVRRGLLERVGQGRATLYRRPGGEEAVPGAPAASPAERTILEAVAQEDRITTRKVMERTGLSNSSAKRILAGLVERGLLERHGRGRATRYLLVRERS